MPSNALPQPVSRFISEHIPSVERMEILLLLFENPGRQWAVTELEEQIRSSRESVAQNVAALAAAQLVLLHPGVTETYEYVAGVAATDAIVTELAASYRTRRVAVIEQIYAERRDSIRTFSDAFKLGRPHDR